MQTNRFIAWRSALPLLPYRCKTNVCPARWRRLLLKRLRYYGLCFKANAGMPTRPYAAEVLNFRNYILITGRANFRERFTAAVQAPMLVSART